MDFRKILIMLGAAVLTACGGGSGDGDGGGPVGGIDARGIASVGTISAFGSVVVNGVRYETSNATITVDGDPGTESDLVVGQVVLVVGTLDDNDDTRGTANSVTFDDAVEGPIESIDAPNNSMVVLGQTVHIDANTSFEDDIVPASLDGLNVGDVIEVSGFFDSNGEILATHIELEGPGGEFEVTGFVSNADATAMTFEINSLVVDYSAALLEDFPGTDPENGQLVEAEGTTLGAAGELLATEVEFRGNDLDFDDGDDVEIEGLITRFVSETDFDVSGIPVTTTAGTVYEGGTAADLALNRKVEVEGEFNAAGVLVADKVDFREDGTIRIAGLVDDVQADRLTVLGIEILVTNQTEMKDETALEIRNFSLADVSVGDYVEVRGFDDMGQITATRLERDEDPGEVSLRGFVEAVNDPEFTILGITIQTNANTDFEDDDVPISSTEFFNNADGRLVEADGQWQNGMIIADEVEFEDEFDSS